MCQGPWKPILIAYRRTQVVLFLLLCIVYTQPAFSILSDQDPHGYLGHENITYTSPAFQEEKFQRIEQVKGRIRERAHGVDAEMAVDLEVIFSNQFHELNSMGVSELYMRLYPSWLNHKITVGRRLESWSELDESWKLGIIQPLNQFDYLNRHSQGLTGVFLEFPRGNVAWQFFASPFFIPNQGPAYELRNGEFVETSPWITLPPDQMQVLDVDTPIQYQINRPKLEEVFLKSSFGFKFESISEQFELRAAVLNKPSNNLGLGADVNLNVGGSSYVDVQLKPQVRNHVVKSLDIYHRVGAFKYGVSALAEDPGKQSFDDQWTYLDYSSQVLVSPKMILELSKFKAELSYLSIQANKNRVMGPKADLAGQVFEDLNERSDLVSIKNGIYIPLKQSRKVTFDIEWMQDIRSRGESLSFLAQFYFHRYWKAFGSADLLKSNSATDSFAKFADRDRVSLGVSYVF